MLNFPDTEKKLKSTISRYKSALNKEKKIYGHINDGAGKRYLLFSLYFVLNDLKKSEEYFEWYKKEFDDDVGEPVQKLCWVLSLYRMGKPNEAKYMLADLMLSNLYMIPQILGRDINEYDIWHSSSDGDMDYFDYTPEEVLNALTPEDKTWVKETYDSFVFQRIRQRYIEIYGELRTVKDLESRRKLLQESYSLLDPDLPKQWPKPDIVSICTSPEFVEDDLLERLLQTVDEFKSIIRKVRGSE